MKITMCPILDGEEVYKTLGFHWLNCASAECAENDSYIYLNCKSYRLEGLREDLEDELSSMDYSSWKEYEYHFNSLPKSEREWQKRNNFAHHLHNEIELIEYLNETFDIHDGILIYTSW